MAGRSHADSHCKLSIQLVAGVEFGTEIRLKYQPFQFGELEHQRVFTGFIRFTLNGMQAVPETMISRDMEDMRLP